MHPLLLPKFPIRLGIALAALWCGLAAGAVLIHRPGNIAPAPAPRRPVKAESLILQAPEMAPVLAFDDRWRGQAPAMQHVGMAEAAQIAPAKPKEAQSRPRRAASHADRVCGGKGRRYFHRGRHLSWRCR
ncbi:hypothetical protein [Bradyrhizobium zhanjiangense]|uniref:hypothetical protein n=1 Tax=Bradyrhizobium zhanjiangense TaxID=1325107 RepID=UPI0010089686|nr:hypothetical protein [Bradyrhizobium zhanjiangense]